MPVCKKNKAADSFEYPVLDPVATGQNLYRISRERDMTPKDIRKALNLGSVQAIYKWYSGQSIPGIDSLAALARLFNVPIDEILVLKNGDLPFYMENAPAIRYGAVRIF